MANSKKKRARELKHDRFRDTAINLLDRVGTALEGRGKTILYGLAALVLIGVLAVVFVRWSNRKSDEARQALGRAIELSTATISTTPSLNPTAVTFSSERDRATRAIEEFEKVAAKYGDPYQAEARYFIATQRLVLDRQKGMSELKDIGSKGMPEIAALAKFAYAQALESDGKLDEAATVYSDVVKLQQLTVTPESANLRLAKVYEKQGKKKEAADLLFNLVDASRKAKGPDDKPIPSSSAAREAATELQKLDPARHAQLPPEPSLLG